MILDFDASANDTKGMWLIFPPKNNQKYFVPEENISALRETEDDVMIYLTSKTSGLEQFRIERATLDDIKDVLDLDAYLPIINQEGQKMLLSPKGINAVRTQDKHHPLFEIKVASQDVIWGEGNGSLSFVSQELTPKLQAYLDDLPKTSNDNGWTRLIPA